MGLTDRFVARCCEMQQALQQDFEMGFVAAAAVCCRVLLLATRFEMGTAWDGTLTSRPTGVANVVASLVARCNKLQQTRRKVPHLQRIPLLSERLLNPAHARKP